MFLPKVWLWSEPCWCGYRSWLTEKVWRFDYLMPAELFLLALVGGGLLMWALIRARSHQRVVVWAFAIAAFLLVGGQVFAEVTGLASGAADPAGWRWSLAIAALVAMGVGGLQLIRELFKRDELSVASH